MSDATADPMPEPTPDRGVSELTDEELVKAFELAVIGSTISFEAHISERDNTRAALLRRLAAATERPAADTVTMDRDTAVWAHRAASEMRRAVGEIESQLIWGKVEQNIKAALSAASDGGDCG